MDHLTSLDNDDYFVQKSRDDSNFKLSKSERQLLKLKIKGKQTK